MEAMKKSVWCGEAVSLIGQDHVRNEMPCQDASGFWDEPRPAGIVCDGVGSADHSEIGAKAAVAAFRRALGLFAPWLEQCLDVDLPDEMADGYWRCICKWIARALEESKLECARDHGCEEKSFDYTVSFAVTGKLRCGFFQVGDGMIVASSKSGLQSVFEPDKGGFANETRALRVGMGESLEFKVKVLPFAQANRIALVSDGPVKLLFENATLTPSKLFATMLDDLSVGNLVREDLCNFLTCRKWSEIGAVDDKSIVLMTVSESI